MVLNKFIRIFILFLFKSMEQSFIFEISEAADGGAFVHILLLPCYDCRYFLKLGAGPVGLIKDIGTTYRRWLQSVRYINDLVYLTETSHGMQDTWDTKNAKFADDRKLHVLQTLCWRERDMMWTEGIMLNNINSSCVAIAWDDCSFLGAMRAPVHSANWSSRDTQLRSWK